jgi:hypothetical protein
MDRQQIAAGAFVGMPVRTKHVSARPQWKMEEEMNTNIRTVSVHDTLFGRVANNLEVGQLSRAVEPWFADFHDMRVKQAIADLDEPTRRGAAAEYLGLELSVVA